MRILGSFNGVLLAVGLLAASPAAADPPGPAPTDPRLPDITRNWCPGGQFGDRAGYMGGGGALHVCDGERYPDGSFWHQWVDDNYVGIGTTYHYDCVSGGEPLPGPPPPGGCGGAIPAGPG